jgi:Protein of unknown function (DUF3604)
MPASRYVASGYAAVWATENTRAALSDARGSTHEKVYNVALSNNASKSGSGSPGKSTVDIDTATYTNTAGAVMLSAVWVDPDFDPNEQTFYYARVLEIPTPRWTTYDSAFYGTELPEKVPAQIQERAYTSPIWYTP